MGRAAGAKTTVAAAARRPRPSTKPNESAPPPGSELQRRLTGLVGVDLRLSAESSGVISPGVKPSKSWAQAAVKAAIGDTPTKATVRTIPARVNDDGSVTATSTMPLAKLDPTTIQSTPFAQSGIPEALEDIALVVREQEKNAGGPSKVLAATQFRLNQHPELLARVTEDYLGVQKALRDGHELSGSLGELVQPRTKGKGGAADRTWAFYGRPALVGAIMAAARSRELPSSR